jgi:RNA polymerase sigma-70 factor (ECF subfamily)
LVINGTEQAARIELDAVQRAQTGDQEAFTGLVKAYQRRIYALTRQITQNEQDAEDALQDTFLKAYLHLAEFEGRARFYTWLTRIAVNESIARLRQRNGKREMSLDAPVRPGDDAVHEVAVWEGNPEERHSQAELRAILNQSIAGLPAIYRTVFWLRDVDELSIEETAAALGLSVPAVKTRLVRARLLLRERLTKRFKRRSRSKESGTSSSAAHRR